jgi:general secretion pathway protein C
MLWGLVAASAVFWAMKFIYRGPIIPAVPAVRTSVPQDPAAVARVLGFNPTAPAAAAATSLASRFSLMGVVAGRSQQGAALIAVDGRPPKPYRVGTQVDEALILQSVEPRRAALGASLQGPPALTLELPPRK